MEIDPWFLIVRRVWMDLSDAPDARNRPPPGASYSMVFNATGGANKVGQNEPPIFPHTYLCGRRAVVIF